MSHFPNGVPLGKIVSALKISISRRNVQHRLFYLVRKAQLQAEGKARARLYRLPVKDKTDQQILLDVQKDILIPLSSNAEEIQKKINQPIQARTHVGYNRKFLDEYRPNVTNYLPEVASAKTF